MRSLLLNALLKGPAVTPAPAATPDMLAQAAQALAARARRKLGRSLSIREIDAGSCNGCELEINALNNPVYDIERFGLKFVASPRHADILLVTGPVTCNMKEALQRTFAATPEPKWVVAVGDCAHDCGVFAGSYALAGPVAAVIPVDVTVKGCPPPPLEIMKGLLGLFEAMDAKSTSPGADPARS
jgi:Ni,Fe-hydrogenase III small subunit